MISDPAYRDKVRAQYKKYNEKRKSENYKYRRGPKGQYLYAKRVAGYDGKEFNLSDVEFKELREKPCYYCGGPLPETGIGLDRIDNAKGYIRGNVLPACGPCNQTRNKFYSVEETKVMISALLEFRKSKGAA